MYADRDSFMPSWWMDNNKWWPRRNRHSYPNPSSERANNIKKSSKTKIENVVFNVLPASCSGNNLIWSVRPAMAVSDNCNNINRTIMVRLDWYTLIRSNLIGSLISSSFEKPHNVDHMHHTRLFRFFGFVDSVLFMFFLVASMFCCSWISIHFSNIIHYICLCISVGDISRKIHTCVVLLARFPFRLTNGWVHICSAPIEILLHLAAAVVVVNNQYTFQLFRYRYVYMHCNQIGWNGMCIWCEWLGWMIKT